MLVTDLLRHNAEKFGGDTALVAVDPVAFDPLEGSSYAACRSTLTWQQFYEKTNQIANYYNSIGIGKGSKVSIILRNSLAWLPLYFGIIKAGAVVTPLNYRYNASEIAHSLNYTEADALVFDQRSSPQVQIALEKTPRINSCIFVGENELCPDFALEYEQAFGPSPKHEPNNIIKAEDDVAIYFSSGTTGPPKAVLYTHSTLATACAREVENHGQTKNDCFICIPPLYHVGAKLHWMGNLLVGAKAVLLLRFTIPAFFEAMERERVTIAFLLLPWVQDILFELDNGNLKLEKYNLHYWRLLHMGAQPIPPVVARRILAYLPQLDFDVSYGLTESGGPGCLNLGIKNLHKLGSVGRPAPGWQAKIVDDNGREVPPETPGELLVKGPDMMRCYFKNEKATKATLVDGWLHTGDIAKKDADGFYYIIDRKKDVIISGGENIFPADIEDFLRSHPAIKDVAVFGLPHCRLGEVVAALVEVKPGYSCAENELHCFCEALPKCKRPSKIFFGTVPRNYTGKIEKAKLRQKYADAAKDPVTT